MLLTGVWPWIWFNLFVLVLLALDLGIFHRKSHAVSTKEALIWSAVWISLALAFNAGLYFVSGSEVALQFLTGYLIEKSLSVDNIFIFVLLFGYFSVPAAYQHRVLFWGIMGALVMRGILIAVGSVLIEQFHWIIYIFGAFLIFTGIRMGVQKDENVNPEHNPLVKFVRRFVPVSDDFVKDLFVVRREGTLMITPLLLVLLVIETSDLLFAVDSIPAIFSVTTDPFIVYTSNVFAILGLRSLYFVFANIIHKFHYLQAGLAVILCFVGLKMVVSGFYHVPTWLSLLFIALVLGVAIVASIMRARRRAAEQVSAKVEAAVTSRGKP
ncbi:membrane protein [Dictyobacter aurantiacus]|uniref:Membrane protein n=1 Tax=Dictyobacter aurantiacus TaxID=1936993 RepID=A0A401ZL31_9CHLR|nr:TerC family protein [Dictyobacter aurantiacus]GCE07587.1 membrane protein [Dictyobacter aurantiacus]